MKITAIALDDEPLALKLIHQHCAKLDFIELKERFTDPYLAESYLKKNKIDLIFLDIEMPDISGINFYKRLHFPPHVIFCTAYKDYASEGYEMEAIDYLLKPFDFNRFARAAKKAYEYIEFQLARELNKHMFYVKVNYEMVRINLRDVELIEALDDYIKLYQKPNPVLTLMTLKTAMEKLPHEEFIRVHRSFIVPYAKIERFNRSKIFVAGKEVPIGTSYDDVYDKLVSRRQMHF